MHKKQARKFGKLETCAYIRTEANEKPTMGDINKTIEAFLQYIRYELNLSACTVLSYRNDLRQLQDFLSPNDAAAFCPESVTTDDLRSWMVWLDGAGDGSRTIRRKMQAARAFYKFLMKRGVVAANPAAEIELAQVQGSSAVVYAPRGP